MKMVPRPSNKASLFSKLFGEFKKILKISSPKTLVTSVLYGNNLINIMLKLLKTLEREEAGACAEAASRRFEFWRDQIEKARQDRQQDPSSSSEARPCLAECDDESEEDMNFFRELINIVFL